MTFSLNYLPKDHLARLLSLLLLVLTLGVYWQVVHFDFILLDDQGYVLDNVNVRDGFSKSSLIWAFTSFDLSNWHPLTWLSHMLDVQFYGLNPAGHHLTNVIIHCANSLLLYLLLREATQALWRSFLVTALFALHPLHIESVAWVSERKDVLCGFFWLLTMICYTRYARKLRKVWYLLAFCFFILGLLSKPMIVTLPFVLLLWDYWPLDRLQRQGMSESALGEAHGTMNPSYAETSLKRLFYEKIPFLILTVVSCTITYLAQNKGRAIQSWESLPLMERILNALHSYVQYIFKMLWPQDLAIFYPHPGKLLDIWTVLAATLALVALSVVAWLSFRVKPYLVMGWLWFLGTLVPVIGIVQVGAQGMADRYTYIPLIGLLLALVWGLADFLVQSKVRWPIKSLLSIAIVSAVLSTTEVQLGYWNNTATLFNRAISTTKGNFMAHYILANQERQSGNMVAYHEHYGQAVASNPRFVALMHNFIGYQLVKAGTSKEAVSHFEAALRIMPDYLNARNNLGVALAKSGRFDEAIEQFRTVLKKDPHYALALDSLYNIYRERVLRKK